MKHVLVTGASGFVASYVIPELLRRGCSVTASSRSADNASNAAWFPAVNFMPFDLSKSDTEENLFDYFGRPDALVHLAWQGLPDYKSAIHLETNLPLQQTFLKNLLMHGLTDLTVTGTCFEYGMHEGCMTETMPAQPANAYAIAKNELRIHLEALQSTVPFNLKWVRLFYMYGKGQHQKSLFSQLQKAVDQNDASFNMSGGAQIRDFLPVEKVAVNIAAIALQQQVTGIINCCSGHPVTIKSLVDEYLHQRKANIQLNLGYYPYTDYEPMAFWGDNKKLLTIINNE